MNKLIIGIVLINLAATGYLLKLAHIDYANEALIHREFICKIAEKVGAFGCSPQIYERDK